ncbi:hypothetical protein A9G34_05505 [Gilliamella sp. Choc4-2]|uniref:putative type VI secretion system effector n=1 Tax=Gilliamella sp. Choc4-2 TaxID=3120237 RepID=UPI00080E756D|nr:putative type VI secretion system effector [Gilliamella apicola]OCG46057.1 hypothetical protein A9G34_05505 [Gilliamella apicola]
MKVNSDYYQIITGKITELEVIDTHLSLFGGNSFASLPLLGQLALGNSAEAASQVGMASGQQEAADYLNSVQYFRCKLGEFTVHGIFCRAFFRNGDKVEVVVEPLDDGSYYAYALRRPIDHRLWLYPWAMKGSKASNKSSLKFAGTISGGIFIATIICIAISINCATIKSGRELLYFLIGCIGAFIFDGLIFLILFYSDKAMLGGGSKDADKIFATLGYPKPKTVNMEQEYMEMFFNNKSMNEPNFYIDVNTDEFKRKDPPGVKWVAFYREAPPIPDYITVIHTEKTNNNKRKK